jgi:hypothetical protein
VRAERALPGRGILDGNNGVGQAQSRELRGGREGAEGQRCAHDNTNTVDELVVSARRMHAYRRLVAAVADRRRRRGARRDPETARGIEGRHAVKVVGLPCTLLEAAGDVGQVPALAQAARLPELVPVGDHTPEPAYLRSLNIVHSHSSTCDARQRLIGSR